jgi:maltose-binding protein MalE
MLHIRPFALLLLTLLASSATLPCLASDEITLTYTKKNLGPILEDISKTSGIRINAQFKDQGEVKSNVMEQAETGNLPDAIIIPADHVGLYKFIKYSPVTPKMFSAQIPLRIWESGKSDGQIYGAPLTQGNHLVLYYNKRLIKEPAHDWQEMLAQKAQLEAKGRSTIAWSYDQPFWLLPFVGAFGGWPLNNGKITLNTPAMTEALEFYITLRTQSLPYPNCSYECTMDSFTSGKVAYTINGDWAGKDFATVLGDDLGVSAIPATHGKKMISTFSTYVISFPNNSLNGPKREALIRLVNSLQSKKVQQQIWEQTASIPVENAAFKDAQANATGYLKQTIALMNDTKPLPADPAMSFIWDAMGKGFIRYREGALTAPNAAKYMQKLAERYVQNAEQQEKAPH